MKKFSKKALFCMAATFLFCFAACKNSSSSEDDYKNFGGTTPTTPNDKVDTSPKFDYSLGDAPSEDLKVAENDSSGNKNFSVLQSAEGIYIKFAVPKDTWRGIVDIDGIGQVAESVWFNESMTEGSFFYPFLNAGAEYTVRIKFQKDENRDDEGFVIDTPDQMIGWFDVKATAGANSKGLVRLTDFGEVDVKNNGNFKFTKKPAFENEGRLTGNGYDWMVNIGLVEGVSWEHPNRKTKWNAEVEISRTSLTETRNFYTTECTWKSSEFSRIDFICYRPILYYNYDGKVYKYQWWGRVQDTPELKTEAELWTSINVNNSADVAKIQGTWTDNGEWNNTDDDSINVHVVYNSVLVIGATAVENWSYTYTKLDGSAFTKEELLDDYIRAYSYRYETVNSSEVKEFEESLSKDSKVLNFKKELLSSPGTEEVYRYTIYTFPDNYCTLSNDSKTLTQKYGNTERPLSEYFADRKYDDGYTKHYDLKLFNDSLLRIIQSGTESDGEDYEWYNEYKKQ